MLKLHKIKYVSDLIARSIVFILFYKQDWKRGVFKIMKNDRFLVLLPVWVFFPKFLGSLMSSLF